MCKTPLWSEFKRKSENWEAFDKTKFKFEKVSKSNDR